MNPPSHKVLQFDRFALDVTRGFLRMGETEIYLRPKTFEVLHHLVQNAGRLVRKEDIFAAVWPKVTVSDDSLTQCIRELREKLHDDDHRLIKTVPRRGYLLDAAVGSSAPPPALPGVQTVTFCRTVDAVRLAVATVGEGDALLKTGNWLNHVEYDWESPVWAPTLSRWASGRKLIRYDQRGTGLSDWDVADLSFDAFVRDFETVVETAGVKRFAILGMSQGAGVALAFAARHPEMVTGLVLHGAYVLGRNRRTAVDREQAEAHLMLIRQGWGHPNSAFMQAFSSLYLPGGTPEQIKWFCDLQRSTTSPENAVAIRRTCDDIDVLDLLPRVRVPTLVLHSRNESVVPFDHGRMIASLIPGAKFVGLDSSNHVILPQEPAWEKFMSEIEQFLSAPARP